MSHSNARSQAAAPVSAPTTFNVESSFQSGPYDNILEYVGPEKSTGPLWVLNQELRFPHPGKRKSNAISKADIPGPRNAFYLFRSFLAIAGVLPRMSEQLRLKITAYIWHALPQHERERFTQMLPEERRLHQLRYPEYKPSTNQPRRRTPKGPTFPTDDDPKYFEGLRCMGVAELVLRNVRGAELLAGCTALEKTELGVGGANLAAAYMFRVQNSHNGGGMQVAYAATPPAGSLSDHDSGYHSSQSHQPSSRMMATSTSSFSKSSGDSYATTLDWNMDASTQGRAFDDVAEFDHYQDQDENPFVIGGSYEEYQQALLFDGSQGHAFMRGSMTPQGGYSQRAYAAQSHTPYDGETFRSIPTHLLR